jgi:hypothetical protein
MSALFRVIKGFFYILAVRTDTRCISIVVLRQCVVFYWRSSAIAYVTTPNQNQNETESSFIFFHLCGRFFFPNRCMADSKAHAEGKGHVKGDVLNMIRDRPSIGSVSLPPFALSLALLMKNSCDGRKSNWNATANDLLRTAIRKF